MTTTVTSIFHGQDLYEIAVRDQYTIVRITRYFGGEGRQDLEFDELLPEVQKLVIERIGKLLNQ